MSAFGVVSDDWVKVEDMTPEQQIERLVRQRNALWRLVEEFALTHGDDSEDGLRPEDPDYAVDVEEDDDGDVVIRLRNNPLDTVRELRRAAGRIWDDCDKITQDAYWVEGVNPAVGEDESDKRDTDPYMRVSKEMGKWR